jgi:hypothetical protein
MVVSMVQERSDTTPNVDSLASHVACARTCQEGNDASNLLWLAQAAQWSLQPELLSAGLMDRLRFDGPRRDRVDSNSLRAQLL